MFKLFSRGIAEELIPRQPMGYKSPFNVSGPPVLPGELSVFDAGGLILLDPQPFFPVFFVIGISAFKQQGLAVPFKGQNVGGDAV